DVTGHAVNGVFVAVVGQLPVRAHGVSAVITVYGVAGCVQQVAEAVVGVAHVFQTGERNAPRHLDHGVPYGTVSLTALHHVGFDLGVVDVQGRSEVVRELGGTVETHVVPVVSVGVAGHYTVRVQGVERQVISGFVACAGEREVVVGSHTEVEEILHVVRDRAVRLHLPFAVDLLAPFL